MEIYDKWDIIAGVFCESFETFYNNSIYLRLYAFT